MICLPDQMMEEILVRLPVKSLKRFECVCKEWCDLIKSQHFIDVHLKHPSQKKNSTDYLILVRSTDSDFDKSLSFYSRDEHGTGVVPMEAPSRSFPPKFPASYNRLTVHRVFVPCNGIVGLVVRYGDAYEREEAIYLCNPATGESRRLPDRTLEDHLEDHLCCYGTCACGLGYDPCTREYKVVSALYYDDDHSTDEDAPIVGVYRMGIYYLSSNTWREVDEHDLPDTYEYHLNLWRENGVHMKGRLHWLIERKTIMYFDISNETMGQITCPETDTKGTCNCKYIGLLEDSLAFVVVLEDETCSVVIWTMVEYGSWMKRFSFSLLSDYRIFTDVILWTNVMILFESGHDGLTCVDLVEDDDCGMKTFKVVDDLTDDYSNVVVGAVIVRGQSLVPLR